jgi:pimeloyl-ACP methyl ester carboxylesterase
LHFEEVGSGLPLVLIPNGIQLKEDFEPLGAGRTLVFYDVRNRGRSQSGDPARLARGIAQDVDDLEAVRRHFGAGPVDLVGHSYIGLMVLRYAMEHPAHVGRVVAIGAIPPDPRAQYPAHLSGQDETLRAVLAELAELQQRRAALEPTEFCRKAWSVLRPLYVVDPKDADRIRWDRCELPNERGVMKYWIEILMPSIQAFVPTAEMLARQTAPVLIVHGRKDRSSPYGGARDWALRLPNARLLSVADAAHAPWIEAPETLASIRAFLDGRWPATAEKIAALD